MSAKLLLYSLVFEQENFGRDFRICPYRYQESSAVAEPDNFQSGGQTTAHTGVAQKLISYFFSVWQVAVDLVVFLAHSLIYLYRQ